MQRIIIHRLKRLCYFCSGEDAYIIKKCNKQVRVGFALTGLFVQVVFALCWWSAVLFMSHIFDGARWISIPLGIFWALLVTNLYLLLLYTISPALLPVAERKKTAIGSKAGRVVTRKNERAKGLSGYFSLMTRIGLIVFLAIVIAQPFNVWLFAPRYEDADRYAAAIQEVWHTKSFSRVATVLFCVIMLLPVYFKYRVRKISGRNFENDFGSDEASSLMRDLREQLSNPTRHQVIAAQILSADINTIRTSDFYFQKTLIEYRIVLEEYEQFKKNYSDILTAIDKRCKQACRNALMPYLYQLERINPERYDLLYPPLKKYLQAVKIEPYEYWADPPFRTAYRSPDRMQEEQSGLLQMFYPDKQSE